MAAGSGIDAETIKLIGRWQSDAMLLCLRVVAATSSHHCSQDVLANGRHTCPQGAITGPTYHGPPPPQAPAPVQNTCNIITAPTAVNLH